MEDVLEVYHREFDVDTVLVCMDETSKQQTKETRMPRPVRPDQPTIVDFEDERNGVANLFIVFPPLFGWRWVKVTERRIRHDWANRIRELVNDIFPGKKIVLVMDNLNIHSLASPREAFEPAEARRIAECLEIHYTPKHGSWLNRAEIEIGVMHGIAWRGAFPTASNSAARPGPGRRPAIANAHPSSGGSRQKMLASS